MATAQHGGLRRYFVLSKHGTLSYYKKPPVAGEAKQPISKDQGKIMLTKDCAVAALPVEKSGISIKKEFQFTITNPHSVRITQLTAKSESELERWMSNILYVVRPTSRPGSAVSAKLVDLVWKLSKGNPLFVEELTQHFHSLGLLARSEALVWEIRPGCEKELNPVPVTLLT